MCVRANDSSGPSWGTIDKRIPQKCTEAIIFRGPGCDKTPWLPYLAQDASALPTPISSPRVHLSWPLPIAGSRAALPLVSAEQLDVDPEAASVTGLCSLYS